MLLFKYPTIFNSADAAVITKIDLADAAEFDSDLAVANFHAVRPGMRIFQVSSRAGQGMEQFLEVFSEQLKTRVAKAT